MGYRVEDKVLLVLHVVDAGSTPGTAYGLWSFARVMPLTEPGVNLEHSQLSNISSKRQ